MKVRTLFSDDYDIVAPVLSDDECPIETLLSGTTDFPESTIDGLIDMLEFVAANGLSAMPVKWSHEADKQQGIYEFRKGSLRLFYFKGIGRQIAVCVTYARKSGAKADKAEVLRAAKAKKAYFSAVATHTLIIEE